MINFFIHYTFPVEWKPTSNSNDADLMKSRIYVFLLAASLVFVAHHSSVSAAAILYKKKVQIQPFQNPPGWVGIYNPGNLI